MFFLFSPHLRSQVCQIYLMTTCIFSPESGSKSKEVHGTFSEAPFFRHLFNLLPNSLLSLAVPYFSTKQDMSYVGQARYLSHIYNKSFSSG